MLWDCEAKIDLGNEIRRFVIQRAMDDMNSGTVTFPEEAFLIAVISGGDTKKRFRLRYAFILLL
jgi:hypothetical protein